MMVESRNHLALLSLCVCFGKAAKTLLLLRLLDFRVACRYWVISYSVPFRFSFLLLFLVGERGPCLLRQGARPACRDPYYCRYCRSGVGGRIWVYRSFLWVLIGYIGLG